MSVGYNKLMEAASNVAPKGKNLHVTKESAYRERMRQHLYDSACIDDEDEVEGIIDSHIITYGLQQALDVIQKTF